MNAANLITGARIPLSLLLLCFRPDTAVFTVLYCVCGITDMIDGTVARKTGSAGIMGERLDSIADMVFVLVCFRKLLPLLSVPFPILIWTAGIACVRIANLIYACVGKRKTVLLHTAANKLTGLLLFVFALTVPYTDSRFTAIPVCLAASFASLQEGWYLYQKTEQKAHTDFCHAADCDRQDT